MASEPPHEGAVNDPPPADSPNPAPRGRGRPPGSGAARSHKKKQNPATAGTATQPDLYEPTAGEIENALDLTELALFLPTETILDFKPPKKDVQQKIARLEARIWKKYVSQNVSDEYALAGLLLIWLATNLLGMWMGGGEKENHGQRNNGNLRAQADGKNPLDAPAVTLARP